MPIAWLHTLVDGAFGNLSPLLGSFAAAGQNIGATTWSLPLPGHPRSPSQKTKGTY
ncbi:hypothetical protein BN2156_02398 [Mycolicibacterium neworleansense]|uniref:Uncharacterized protein n=1 Tax=Mycolicibacterium neworleansense TaxID=146018 RepID=A0A0H5RP19_9MYCO|nr:hypothetical protein BN2156_02398 [Mycolicibacterium neworleansense]